MRDYGDEFNTPKSRGGNKLFGGVIVAVCVFFVLAVGFVLLSTQVTTVPDVQPTPAPAVEPTLVPTATPTEEPTLIPTPEPKPIPSPSPTAIPHLNENGWSPSTGMSYDQYMLVYNATNGRVAPHYSGTAKVIGLKNVYAVNDWIQAYVVYTNTGDPVDKLSVDVRIDKFNEVTQMWTTFGTRSLSDEYVLLAENQAYQSRWLNWSVQTYMDIDPHGIWDVYVTVNAKDHAVWSDVYQIIVGDRGDDGTINLRR